MSRISQEVPSAMIGNPAQVRYSVNMNEIVGSHNILFVCLDTLRYDVAAEEQEAGRTPVITSYGRWQKCHAPGNYTLPSHVAMFAGHLPSLAQPMPLFERERLFFPKEYSSPMNLHSSAFLFQGSSFVEGLAEVGYTTVCVGGVGFFNKRSPINRILPNLFQHSYWHSSFSCHIPNSLEHQLDFIERKIDSWHSQKPLFLYLNVDSIHYPNFFYVPGNREDNRKSHAAALRYVDAHMERLFDLVRRRGSTFVILCSDHGTCYGEDGYYFHCLSHEIVYTVPYQHFILEPQGV